MPLNSDLLSAFAKITNDNTKKKIETNVYGTIREYPEGSGEMYVQLDGSDLLTPYEKTADAVDGERVTVTIKNHTATVNGNISSPAVRTGTANDIIADSVTIKGDLSAATAKIEELTTKNLEVTEKLEAAEASIENLEAVTLNVKIGEIDYLNVLEALKATDATVNNFKGTYATIEEAVVDHLESNEAVIESLDSRYANIDFANIGQAAVDKFFATSGIIKNLTLESGVVVKELVGVTIKGDLIEGNTIVADKLIIQGEDGLYYKLNMDELGRIERGEEQTEENGLNGSIITAKSITAEKISVSDLEAFKATIGGFHIGDHSLYSGVKSSSDNTTEGIYLGDDGSLNVGGQEEFLRYIPDGNGGYKLEISADSISIKVDDGSKDINDSLDQINSRLDLMITEDQLKLEIDNIQPDNVRTKTGYVLDDEGFRIEKSDSPTTTQITNNGMYVRADNVTVLEANAHGVDAKNLNASTFLIVGGRSRFENYDNNKGSRTACFWVGG